VVVGDKEGRAVGASEGDTVSVGAMVSPSSEGLCVGLRVGLKVGLRVGLGVGLWVGLCVVGLRVGLGVGLRVGLCVVGLRVGFGVGLCVGTIAGWPVGSSSESSSVGESVVASTGEGVGGSSSVGESVLTGTGIRVGDSVVMVAAVGLSVNTDRIGIMEGSKEVEGADVSWA
jgi:hypothetical protein